MTATIMETPDIRAVPAAPPAPPTERINACDTYVDQVNIMLEERIIVAEQARELEQLQAGLATPWVSLVRWPGISSWEVTLIWPRMHSNWSLLVAARPKKSCFKGIVEVACSDGTVERFESIADAAKTVHKRHAEGVQAGAIHL